MNRARLFTLLGLVVVVVLFAAAWLSLPVSGGKVSLPARLFTTEGDCVRSIETRERTPTGGVLVGFKCLDYSYGTSVRLSRGEVSNLKKRIVVVLGSAAFVIVLLGLAFGAARRERHEATSS